MKKALLILFAAIIATTMVYAEEPIFIADHSVHNNTSIPRSPALIPFECFVDAQTYSIRFECVSTLGLIDICLVNEDIGENQTTSIYAYSGTQNLPFFLVAGTYSIYFATDDGRMYYGYFII